MDRKNGSAVLLMLAASAFYPHGGSSGGGIPPQPGNLSAKGAVKTSSGEGPWTPFCEHFRLKAEDEPDNLEMSITIKGQAAGSKLKTEIQGAVTGRKQKPTSQQLYCLPPTRPTIRAMIATVSDPERTHLSLDFDRDVESIVWAVGDEGYSLESYWFPWQPNPDKEVTGLDKVKATEEDQNERLRKPGMMLFRKTTELLAVFLVGETPTSGPSRIAFRTALEGIDTLAPDSQSISMVGPSFSGSLMPLQRLVIESNREYKKEFQKQFYIVSGRVTSKAEIDRFQREADHVTLSSTLENDSFALDRFVRYINEWGLPPQLQSRKIALLSEDETTYGGGDSKLLTEPPRNTMPILKLRFPRGISRLRNSNEELPGLSPTQANPKVGYQHLPLVLKDTGADTVRSFSQQLTPVSSETELMSLADTLRKSRIQYAGIMATDPLDVLFLSRFLRALCPDLQLFVLETDLLFVRAAHDYQLEGLLTISNYPLFLQNQEYQSPSRRTPFSSSYAEGTYNACRRIMLKWQGDAANNCCPKKDLMLEYSSPFIVGKERVRQPALWLSVVGHDNLWPIALLDNGYRTGPQLQSTILQGPPLADPTRQFPLGSRSPTWKVLAIASLLYSFANLAVVFLMNWPGLKPGLKDGWSKPLRQYDAIRNFARYPERSYTASRAAHVVVILIAVMLINVLFLLPAWLVSWWERWVFVGIIALTFLEAIWMTCLCFSKQKLGPPVLAGIAWVLGIVCLALLITPVVSHSTGVSHSNEFFAYRAIHPESGVSPTAPLLLLAIAFYYWGWIQLRRLRLAAERRPLLPPKIDIRPPTGFRREVEGVFGDQTTRYSLPLILIFLFCCPFSRLRTFEGHFYDFLIALALCMIYVMLIGNCVRFTLIWNELQVILKLLERHPLREAFSRLPHTFSWTSVWRGDVNRFYLTFTRSRDCLRRFGTLQLMETIDAHIKYFQSEERKEVELDGAIHLNHRAKLERIYAKAASSLITGMLTQKWNEGSSESILESRRRVDETNPQPPKEDSEADLWFAGEFVALRYVEYIRYVLLQMRNFLEFTTTGFILMTIALMVYPFEGHHALNTVTLTLFTLLGITVILVFAKMERDPLLSRLNNTKPNQLDWSFFMRIISFGALPLATLLGSQFPAIGNFLFSWIQPALQAVK
jgi:hypothetical protein